MIRALTGATVAAACLLLPGCLSTAYGPVGEGRPYGYTETKHEDGTYVLRIVHPDSDLAMKFWDQRAAELCNSTVYKKNIYFATRPTLLYSSYGGTAGAAQIEGSLDCNPAQPASTPAG